MQTDSIKILIADDHPIVLDGVRRVLEQHREFNVVAEARTGLEAVDLALKHQPDVVIMDITMPDLNGIDATRKILSRQRRTKVIALSIHSQITMIQAMLKAGACAYVAKNSLSSELVDAIRAVMGGRLYFARSIEDEMRKDSDAQRDEYPSVADLTSADREVLLMTAEGLSAKEIASHLNTTVRAVDKRRQRLKARLNVDSLAGLTKYAIHAGITPLQ